MFFKHTRTYVLPSPSHSSEYLAHFWKDVRKAGEEEQMRNTARAAASANGVNFRAKGRSSWLHFHYNLPFRTNTNSTASFGKPPGFSTQYRTQVGK